MRSVKLILSDPQMQTGRTLYERKMQFSAFVHHRATKGLPAIIYLLLLFSARDSQIF